MTASPPAIADALQRLWVRFLPEIQNRAALVESAVRAIAADSFNTGTEALRRQGYEAAHKLAGSLGTFGLQRGTELARRLELWLEASAPREELTEALAWATELREMLSARR